METAPSQAEIWAPSIVPKNEKINALFVTLVE